MRQDDLIEMIPVGEVTEYSGALADLLWSAETGLPLVHVDERAWVDQWGDQ